MNVILSILLLFSQPFYSLEEPIQEENKANGLTIIAENKKAKEGESVCMNVSVADFKSLLSMQYSIQWDASVLTLEKIQGFNLPFLSVRNFGQHKVNEGILTVVWIDNNLKGVNVSDGTAIFQLCFKVKGKRGSGTEVKFATKPTPYEVVNIREQILPLNPVSGSIVVQ